MEYIFLIYRFLILDVFIFVKSIIIYFICMNILPKYSDCVYDERPRHNLKVSCRCHYCIVGL
jgi:hypothetical protein